MACSMTHEPLGHEPFKSVHMHTVLYASPCAPHLHWWPLRPWLGLVELEETTSLAIA